MSSQKLYLAGPLFNASERSLGEALRSVLSKRFQVYLPHIDGSLLPDLVGSGMSPDLARAKIFDDDIAALRSSDAIMVILNGRTVDEGAAFELGVAWSLGKRCLGYKDDFRQLTQSGDNPMIERSLEIIFTTIADLERWLERSS